MNNPKIKDIQQQCEAHEHFLKELVRGNYAPLRAYLPGELCFGIARRWNSWYPSYFDVAGGCYVLIPGDMDPDHENNKKDSRNGIVVIDPGFKFIDILRANYQIEPQDISTVIVTHFHPDHMAGLLEYAMIMNTSRHSGNLYLNETAFATFRTLENAFITVNELHDGQIQELMSYVTRDRTHVRVTLKAIGVHHNELGNQHRSLGVILETIRSENQDFTPHLSKRYQIGILGDTDAHEDYIGPYVNNFYKVDILVVHLGTFSDAKLGRGGKHLYIEGVKRVLRRMREKVKEAKEREKIVVLSEFGLELADEDSFYQKLRPFIESHFWRLPLIFATLYLKNTGENEHFQTDKEGSRFFARATLASLEKIYEPSEQEGGISQPGLTYKEKEEFLLAFGFQILALYNQRILKIAEHLQTTLTKSIENDRKNKLIDSWSTEEYLTFLRKELPVNSDIAPLRLFFDNLVERANFTQHTLPFERLIECCSLLIRSIGDDLESPIRALYYVDKLTYISKYAESKGITQCRRVYSNSGGITDLNTFWTTGLIGAFLLREALQKASKETESSDSEPTEECLLLQIGEFFQEDALPWANLLVGDIGCTFSFDPFKSSDSQEREDGIKLKSAQGDWISPYDARGFYDAESKCINYHTPDQYL